MKKKIIIIGAGGHGKVVADTILAQDKYELIGFADLALPVGEEIIKGYKVIEKQSDVHLLKGQADVFVVAVGNNVVREQIYRDVAILFDPVTIIHPSAIIGSDVKIGTGTVVLANTVISTSCIIGDNTIVNAGTVVDHDCSVGNNVHLSIGTKVGSNSKISDGCTTEIGGAIKAFSTITNWHF